jgi:hypothetical protein
MRDISAVMVWAGRSGGAEGGCRCRLAGKASLLITWPFCPLFQAENSHANVEMVQVSGSRACNSGKVGYAERGAALPNRR